MDFSKVSRSELAGAVASVILIASIFLLNWYELAPNPARDAGEGFVCGVGDFSCTGFDTFPVARWLLIAAAAAPFTLAYIVARGHKLSWAPGELTMVVGFTAFVLIAYNGLIDKPGSQLEEVGVSLEPGYFVALLASAGIAASGVGRVTASQKGNMRKTPGTV